jgi:hypothetical protein
VECCDAGFGSSIVCKLRSTDLANDTGDRDNGTLPSTNHAREESLGSVEVGKEVDSEVAVDFIQGKVDKSLAVDNGSIIDQDCWCSKLRVISLIP